MSDVFISYSHKDTPFVRDLIRPLESEGFSVWWDHTIPPGKTWDDVIARGIREAKACIIVWSPDSVISDWVKEEATLAKEGGKYLPIRIGVEQPPMGFRRIQAADLRHWNGNTQDPQWRMLITEVANLAGVSHPPAPPPPLLEKALRWLRAHRRSIAMLSLGAATLIAVMVAIWWYATASAPQRQAAAITTKFPPTPSPPKGGVDPAMVGVITLDTVVADFNTHYVNTINADGSYVLTGTQEEDGENSADANGNYRNVGTNTGRVHTGKVQIIDATHFQANTTVYQLTQPVLPPGQPNPSLLGTWSANGMDSGQLWTWTFTSRTPGHYHFEGHMSDRGHASFANGQWTATSSVTSQSGGGTYGIIDAGHILVNGAVWTRQ